MKLIPAFLIPPRWRRDRVSIPIVRLSGAIGGVSRFQTGLTLAGVESGLKKAFSMGRAPAVAIVVNSPGGAPVQSHLIFKRIRALAAENKKQVIVAVEDVAASGGYMIALAGDEIIVDESSIVGSIGVVSAGFGFTGLLERIGVERRVHTAGKSKAMLDPFRPEKEEDVAHLRSLQDDIHAMFTGLVKNRRGDKLSDDPDLFSGAFWAGHKAVDMGLADQVGELRALMRERYGEKVRLVTVSVERKRLMSRLGIAADSRVSRIAGDVLAMAEERALWSRFGL